VVLVALGACTFGGSDGDDSDVAESDRGPAASAAPSAAMQSPEPAPPLPSTPPWRERPVVDLSFDLSDGLAVVAGRERVVFRPDRRTCRVVFRLWANKPETVRHGNALRVTGARVDGRPVQSSFEARGAPAAVQGSLLRLPVPGCLRPGEPVRVDLRFALTLGPRTPERLGRRDDLAWMATAFPLLAWERGRGWATNPVVEQQGEMAGSEEFRLRRLSVVVPERYDVLGTGRPLGRRPGPRPGTAVEEFTARAVRDVAVTAGVLDVVEREVDGADGVDGVTVHVGGPRSGTAMSLGGWADQSARAIRELADYLGPFPYSDLWVSILPDCPSGVEFPGAIQYADVPPGVPVLELLVSHETAHMWFYGLVGNNQGRDPWLDESFASFAQAVVDGGRAPSFGIPRVARDQVGRPMTWWSRARTRAAYGPGVYTQGSQMLLEARAAAGPDRFDALLREYVADNAHRIGVPQDVRRAFAAEPEVVEILESYGALR
jgi:hypothetical protein